VYVSRDTISASRLSHHLCDLGMLGGGEHQTLNNGPLMPIVVKVGQGALRSSICSLTEHRMNLEQLQEEQNFLTKVDTEICNLVGFLVIQASLLLPSFYMRLVYQKSNPESSNKCPL
jgi:hypothetical protein